MPWWVAQLALVGVIVLAVVGAVAIAALCAAGAWGAWRAGRWVVRAVAGRRRTRGELVEWVDRVDAAGHTVGWVRVQTDNRS